MRTINRLKWIIKKMRRHDSAIPRLLMTAKNTLGFDVDQRDKAGRTNLIAAAKWGDTDSVRKLLVAGARINARTRNEYGPTALILAAFEGHSDVVRVLISHGADVNAGDLREVKHLHVAVVAGHREIVKILIEAGADLNAQEGKEGRTPLIVAIEH